MIRCNTVAEPYVVGAMLTLHCVLLSYSAAVHSPAWDEVAHLAAGISHWRLGNFELYKVNPPLVRMIAALPVFFMPHAEDWRRLDHSPGKRSEFEVGVAFLRANQGRVLDLYVAARWAVVGFGALGGILVYKWSRELYGAPGGVISTCLWCFSPLVLGHGSLLTPDVGAAAVGGWACYAFSRWMALPSWRTVLLPGVLLGLALLTKFTWLALLVVWPMLAIVSAITWVGGVAINFRVAAQRCLQVAVMVILAFQVINLGYFGEKSLQPLGSFRFVSHWLAGYSTTGEDYSSGNRFVGTSLAHLPVPLPANFILGIDVQKADFDRRLWSYLAGEWRHGGWWYFYLYAVMVKEPAGLAGVVICAAWSGCWRVRRRSAVPIDLLVIGVTCLTLFVLVSSQTGFSHHLRYLLPIYPMAFVALGAAGDWLRDKWLRIALALPLGWYVTSSLWVYPHSLSYFNELAGGANCGTRYLAFSNTDWGQDLALLQSWRDHHPEVAALTVVLDMPFVTPQMLGMDGVSWLTEDDGRYRRPYLSTDPACPHRWWAVSVNQLIARNDHWRFLREVPERYSVGYSFRIYRLPIQFRDRK